MPTLMSFGNKFIVHCVIEFYVKIHIENIWSFVINKMSWSLIHCISIIYLNEWHETLIQLFISAMIMHECSLVQYAKAECWEWMWMAVKLWGARGILCRLNTCETKWGTVRGSELFQVTGVASGSGWRMWEGCGTQNEWGVWSLVSLENSVDN